ncbi:hypothetical protein KEJ27_09100 [Candidatus Bathyarchaeota archaeon]|nr:hypothetical protein [Candidatus Bathyarchaeota archaeon]MBS7618341.1 hypothetical protein [Candidatus Bathyarchaeota archaeon]
MLKSRKALSEIISTVIIAGSLLIIAAIASWLTVSMFEVQGQQAELERAKEAFLNLAEAIEEVASKPGASAYVRFSPRAGGVEFQLNYAVINIMINEYKLIDKNITGAIRYRGGPYASISSKVILRGNETILYKNLPWDCSLIVNSSKVPIAWVYTNPDRGKYIYLDTVRVKVNELGNIIINGYKYKVIEVIFINLTYGEAHAGTIVDTKVSCIDKTVVVEVFSSESIRIEVNATILSGDAYGSVSIVKGLDGCVVYFVVSTVRVDFL